MKKYKIAVAGTGYVGLSIATLLSQHHHETAVDIIPEKVEMINNRKSPIQDDYIEKYLAEKELNLTVNVEGHLLYNMILNDGRILGSVCNKFYRAESIRDFSFLTELEYCEDLVFNAELVEKNNLKAVIVGYPIYHYIINEESATNNKDRLFTNDSRLKYIVALERLLGEASDRKYKAFTEYKIVTLALDFLFHDYVDGERKSNLKEAVDKYKWGFLNTIIVNLPFGGLKWLVKGFIVSIRGLRGN